MFRRKDVKIFSVPDWSDTTTKAYDLSTVSGREKVPINLDEVKGVCFIYVRENNEYYRLISDTTSGTTRTLVFNGSKKITITKTSTTMTVVFSAGEAYDYGETDTTLTLAGVAADAKATGDAVNELKADLGAVDDSLTSRRSGTLVLNPMAFYRYTQDGVTAVDFSTMPLNSYVYAQFSVVKSALINANFPLSWSDTDYIHMVRLAAGNNQAQASIIIVFNFTKTQSAEMLYMATSSGNKYRWLLPTTDFTKEYLPVDAKAVGDALAGKQDVSTLINGRNNVVINPWGTISAPSIGNDVDFRTFPMNTSCYTTYQYIKLGLSDTNMPETDWADGDYVVLCKTQISHASNVENSIITLYNVTKIRKIEMIYVSTSQNNKYRWLTANGGTVNYNTFENTINQYSNSYNVSASPSITVDTNNYLHPTGDQTDMSTAIVTMLTQTGICNLAPGDFYVSGIEMPDDSMLRGCGASTNIILLSSVTNGFTIKMGSRCIIDSVTVSGDTVVPTITSDIGTRDGILWQGTAIPEQSTTSNTPVRGMISNCIVRNFSGSGIRCYGTGTGISNCLNVSNVYVYNSVVGINIEWLSEFHRFTNVDCRGCYYGIINNGGNNTFANCGFSKNIIGLLMDNTYGQSNNNSHGSFSNCVFNHSGNNNDGVAIHIIGCTNGEIFTGCQLFYGEIVIEESEGIVFANCNFGGSSGTQISITNGGLIMYNGCCFKSSPTVIKSGNTATKFVNCYLRDGTAVTIS